MYRQGMVRGGAALAVAAVLAVVGCSSNSGGGGTPAKSADTPKDAAKALTDATVKLQEQSFRTNMRMSVGMQATMSGAMDPKQKSGEFIMMNDTIGQKMKTTMRIVGGVTYVKMYAVGATLPGMDGKAWRKLAGAGDPASLGSIDTFQMTKSLEASADVKWVGEGNVTGTLDLTKSGKSLGIDDALLAKLPAKTIPFEASLDGEGRLVQYVFSMPAIDSQQAIRVEIKYSDFGTPVKVEAPPASEIIS